MKYIIIAGLSLFAIVAYLERNSMQTVTTQSFKSFIPLTQHRHAETLSSVNVAKSLTEPMAPEDFFAKIETVDSLVSQYQSLSEPELREKILKLKTNLESQKLIEKANTGIINKEEKRRLAYYIRLNVALHHILISKEI